MQEWKGIKKYDFPKINEVTIDQVPLPCIAELKWDGELTFLFFDTTLDKWVTVNNWGHYRTDYDVTEFAEMSIHCLNKNKVYIGELHAGKNLYDFLRNKSNDKALHLTIFGVLEDNPSERKVPYSERMKEFNLSTMEALPLSRIEVNEIYSRKDLETFFDYSTELGFEGIVCRSLDGSQIWKVKKQRTADVVVLGISKEGKGFPRQEIGAVLIGLRFMNSFIQVGKCGIGFNAKLKKDLFRILMIGKTSEDKKYVYVKPRVVLEVIVNDLVETEKWQSPLTFRSARFKRFRPEKPAEDCSLFHQLPEMEEVATWSCSVDSKGEEKITWKRTKTLR